MFFPISEFPKHCLYPSLGHLTASLTLQLMLINLTSLLDYKLGKILSLIFVSKDHLTGLRGSTHGTWHHDLHMAGTIYVFIKCNNKWINE